MDKKQTPIGLAIKKLGGPKAVASLLSETPQAVVNWRLRGQVPVHHCYDLVSRVKGLRFWHVRPKDWHKLWPGVVGTRGSPKTGKA